MGLGSTARKVQALAERAEQLYEQMKDLQRRIVNLEESVDESTDRLRAVELEQEKQRVLVEAVAREHGVDVDEVLAEAAIEEAEPEGEDTGEDASEPGEQRADESEEATAAETEDARAVETDDARAAEEPTVVDESGQPVE